MHESIETEVGFDFFSPSDNSNMLRTSEMAQFNADFSNTQTYKPLEFLFERGSTVSDPFCTTQFKGTFLGPNGDPHHVEGFCDAQDGSTYRLRFLPKIAGPYRYSLTWSRGVDRFDSSGDFTVQPGDSRGMVTTKDWGFVWSETQEPFFFHATTAYLLMGLSEDVIAFALKRLAENGVNRIRVTLCSSRQRDGGRWCEPTVKPRSDFTFYFGPWLQGCPDSPLEPRFDTRRFDVSYWQKFERMVAKANELGILVQVIFFLDAQEAPNYPFDRDRQGDDPLERLYYSYGVARLAAFPNVEWCISNEWALYRSDQWVEEIGKFISSIDPYNHLLSVHGHGHFPFRNSEWCTHALFQVWDEEGGYDWMIKMRAEQQATPRTILEDNLTDHEERLATGRIIPQVNEEYGYEDHYPLPWGGNRVHPARSTENRRRLAWQIVMAGGHQTTGETSANGLGGWINGLGDDSMTLLAKQKPLRTLFESLPAGGWEPSSPSEIDPIRILDHDSGVRVIYCPNGEEVPENLLAGASKITSFCPRTGNWGSTQTPGDWVTVAYR